MDGVLKRRQNPRFQKYLDTLYLLHHVFKKICVHTLRFWIVFARSHKSTIVTGNSTIFYWCMGIDWYLSPWRGRFQKPPHVSPIPTIEVKLRFQKSPLLRAFLKRCVFGDLFHPLKRTVGQNGENKSPFSYKNRYVRTGPTIAEWLPEARFKPQSKFQSLM